MIKGRTGGSCVVSGSMEKKKGGREVVRCARKGKTKKKNSATGEKSPSITKAGKSEGWCRSGNKRSPLPPEKKKKRQLARQRTRHQGKKRKKRDGQLPAGPHREEKTHDQGQSLRKKRVKIERIGEDASNNKKKNSCLGAGKEGPPVAPGEGKGGAIFSAGKGDGEPVEKTALSHQKKTGHHRVGVTAGEACEKGGVPARPAGGAMFSCNRGQSIRAARKHHRHG